MRFLFVDRIVQSIPGQLVRGVKHITRDDPYIYRDSNGELCFFPSLIGETLGQLAAWNVMENGGFTHRPVAGVVALACMHRPAFVGETLLLESFIDCLDEGAVQYHSIASIANDVVFTIEGALGPLLPMDDFIEEHVVRQQYQEIYRPGEWSSIIQQDVGRRAEAVVGDVILPASVMQFDRVLSCIPGESIHAEKRLTRAAPYFPDHFPKKPVLPLTVLLECILSLAHELVALSDFDASFKVLEMRKIKMSGFVYPGDVVMGALTVKQQTAEELILSARCEVDGKRVCVLEVVLTEKGTR